MILRFPVVLAVALLIGAGVVTACFSEHVAPQTSTIDARAVCADPSSAGSDVVIIKDFTFVPATVTVSAGGSVTWVNCESTAGLAHTATSDASGFDSGLLAPLATYTQTFKNSGSIPYHCTVHPSMKATVVVN